MDPLHARLNALEQQVHPLTQHTQTATRRLRWWRGLVSGFAVLAVLTWALPTGSAQADEVKDNGQQGPHAARLVGGLEGGSGSTLGPGGALYVTEGLAGRISRIDPQTGEVTTVASGLPKPGIPGYPFGGAVDVAFLGTTAYVLVAVVSPSDVVGIYRVDGPDSFTVVADIGTFSARIRRAIRSSTRGEASTRWNPTVAASWSPTGTTTACCGSPSTARSPR
jgi:hypothetical protein